MSRVGQVGIDVLELIGRPGYSKVLNEAVPKTWDMFKDQRCAWSWVWFAASACNVVTDAQLLEAFSLEGEGSILKATVAMQGSPQPMTAKWVDAEMSETQ